MFKGRFLFHLFLQRGTISQPPDIILPRRLSAASSRSLTARSMPPRQAPRAKLHPEMRGSSANRARGPGEAFSDGTVRRPPRAAERTGRRRCPPGQAPAAAPPPRCRLPAADPLPPPPWAAVAPLGAPAAARILAALPQHARPPPRPGPHSRDRRARAGPAPAARPRPRPHLRDRRARGRGAASHGAGQESKGCCRRRGRSTRSRPVSVLPGNCHSNSRIQTVCTDVCCRKKGKNIFLRERLLLAFSGVTAAACATAQISYSP